MALMTSKKSASGNRDEPAFKRSPSVRCAPPAPATSWTTPRLWLLPACRRQRWRLGPPVQRRRLSWRCIDRRWTWHRGLATRKVTVLKDKDCPLRGRPLGRRYRPSTSVYAKDAERTLSPIMATLKTRSGAATMPSTSSQITWILRFIPEVAIRLHNVNDAINARPNAADAQTSDW